MMVPKASPTEKQLLLQEVPHGASSIQNRRMYIVRSEVTVTRLRCFRYHTKNALKCRTREKVSGISILVFNAKCTRECHRVRYSGSSYGLQR
jgi:hypothetical protein